MFSSLIISLFLFISSTSYAQEAKEVESFSKDKSWLNLLYFKSSRSIMLGERYFLSPKGNTNSLAELQETIEVLRTKKKNSEGQYYQCLFPARTILIKSKWPDIVPEMTCDDFEAFKAGIDMGDVYLVFTSSYPNNPASMFGHTLLRFDRRKKGTMKSTKELIGYSLAFQARTNPEDNPLVYTFKGLMGGYQTYAEIKPQYINVGVYNNGESRDMWEHKLDLNPNEKMMLIAHAWELSIAGAFSYYFFDENCSTHLVRLLEVIRPDLEFTAKNQLFVVPQVTYQEIVKNMGSGKDQYRSSLKKNILAQFIKLNESEKNQFFEKLEKDNDLEKSSQALLDTLVDYWKYLNYKKKTNLSPMQKKQMYKILKVRAALPVKSEEVMVHPVASENPAFGHKLSALSLGVGPEAIFFKFRYGFHSFSDFELGHDQNSFINFFDVSYQQANDDFLKVKIADILSLPNFEPLFKNISWRASVNYLNHDKNSGTHWLGGLGLSEIGNDWQYYTLVVANIFNWEDEKMVIPGLNLGVKKKIKENIKYVFTGNLFSRKYKADFEHQLLFDKVTHQYGLSYGESEYYQRFQLLWLKYF